MTSNPNPVTPTLTLPLTQAAKGGGGGPGGINFKPENTAGHVEATCVRCLSTVLLPAQEVSGWSTCYRATFAKRKHADECVNKEKLCFKFAMLPSPGETMNACNGELRITLP